MRTKQKAESKSMGLGVIFIALIIFIIVLSLLFKGFDTIRKAKYDSHVSYYILLKDSDGWQDLVLSQPSGSIKILNLKTGNKNLSQIGLPYDTYSQDSDGVDASNIKSRISKVLSKSHQNPLDFIKILLFVNSVDQSEITQSDVNGDNESELKTISSFISDSDISSENTTIEIVNATGVSGVGSTFARMISGIGGNVVLVSTDEKVSKSSMLISSKKDSIALKKLSDMFGLPIQDSTAKISDVKMVIGEDLLKKINL